MKIAITGIGMISAIGRNCTESLQSIRQERSGIGAMRILQSVHTDLPVGEVPFTDAELKRMASIDASEPLPRTSLLGILAAREALQMAGIEECTFINGTTVGGMDLTEQHWSDYHRGEATEHIRLHEAGASTEAIMRHLPTTGSVPQRPTTLSTACSSALNAILLGANLLRTGQTKRVLAGGAESLSRFHLNGFNTLMILDHAPCRPFDANRNGLNLGEGAGYLVLEPEQEALARGAQILGYINGYANTCDAFHQTASSNNGEGAYLAMRLAIEMAGLQPSDISYVNAHGTATPNNDRSESAALQRVFGASMPAVSSTKAFTGHTTSASGGIEAAICVLALQHGFLPANLNWQTPEEGVITPVTHTTSQTLHHILCNAFGFGGNESSLVISDKGQDLSEAPLIEPRLHTHIEVTDNLDIAFYVSSRDARRMTPQMRRIVTAAKQAMVKSGILYPDAIVCATRWGCMVQSMQFLQDMLDSDEQQLKPTPFIQSTHNTVASLIAMLTGNHGYNATYSQGIRSLDNALTDIRTQFSLGTIRSALVLEFDEQTDAWDEVLQAINEHTEDIARATIYTL